MEFNKLLGRLRILGRGAHCDDVAEILSCGKTTVNDMFKSFVKNNSEAYYAVHVYVPEGEELDQVEVDYAKMGFPGCVGSMDVTHLVWKQCSSALRHVCTGRYHYKFNWETMDPNRNDFEDEETEEEKIEIGSDKEVQEVDPTVENLPGHQELSATVTDLAADIPVHAAVMPKNRLKNQMEEVEEVEEVPNPIAEVQQWVLKDALRKHFSYAYSNGQIRWPRRFTHFQKQAMPFLMVRTFSLLLCNYNH